MLTHAWFTSPNMVSEGMETSVPGSIVRICGLAAQYHRIEFKAERQLFCCSCTRCRPKSGAFSNPGEFRGVWPARLLPHLQVFTLFGENELTLWAVNVYLGVRAHEFCFVFCSFLLRALLLLWTWCSVRLAGSCTEYVLRVTAQKIRLA